MTNTIDRRSTPSHAGGHTGQHSAAAGPPPARFGRMQTRGVLLGLSGLRVSVLGLAAALISLSTYLGGGRGFLVTGPLWAVLVWSAFGVINGRVVIDQLPVLAHWLRRRAARQSRYRARVMAPRPAGTLALPGDAAALRFHVDPATGAVMVHDPHRRTLTVVAEVRHPAYVLLAPGDQTQRVSGWARVLAGAAASGTCAGIQILETTLPDPGDAVHSWFQRHAVTPPPGPANGTAGTAGIDHIDHIECRGGIADGPCIDAVAAPPAGTDWFPLREYATLLDTTAAASVTHRSLIAVSLDLRRAGRAMRQAGRGLTGAAQVLRSDMTGLETSLRAASLTVQRWLTAPELAVVIRHAYDPAAELRPADPGASLATAGPVAIDEHWDHLRHDSGYSAVLWISEWPRSDVPADFLHSLVFATGVRKTLSILARPLTTREAMRGLRKEKVDYLTEADQKQRIGRLADLADTQEYQDVLAREQALVAGHADLRYSGFLTVTAPDRDSLAEAVATIDRAAQQSGCETRTLFGQQAQAFAVAALPLARTVN